MKPLTVSPKYQVVIPKEVRERLDIRPGQLVQVFERDGRFEFVPVRSITDMRGFLKGADLTGEIREKTDRL